MLLVFLIVRFVTLDFYREVKCGDCERSMKESGKSTHAAPRHEEFNRHCAKFGAGCGKVHFLMPRHSSAFCTPQIF